MKKVHYFSLLLLVFALVVTSCGKRPVTTNKGEGRYTTTVARDGTGNATFTLSEIIQDSPSPVSLIYGLTAIDSRAIDGTAITELVIYGNVNHLHPLAITKNHLLKTITIHAVAPPRGDKDIITNNTALKAIYVPKKSVEAYMAAVGWSSHAAIIKRMPAKQKLSRKERAKQQEAARYVNELI